eukprot:12113572-Ditylum_brightwellii.AAC.1
MVLSVVKPDIVINMKDLKTKMKTITILKANNNFCTLCTYMEELQQEINAQKGETYLKDDTLLIELFCAAKATTNKKSVAIVDQQKVAWITGKIKDKNTIVDDLTMIYRNMIAEGSWAKTSNKDAKILALTTLYEASKNHMADLEKRIKKLGGGEKLKDKDKYNSKPKKNWQFTKVEKYATHPKTDAKYVWCKHHGKGACMPHPHNHEAWAKKRVAKRKGRNKEGCQDKKQKPEKGNEMKVFNKLQL